MGLFNCAESRKPKKPTPQFKVHCPPASEWTYGTWVGNKEEHERGRKRLSDRARQGTKPEASGKRFQQQDPRGYVDHLRAEVHQPPRRGNVRNSDAQWATLAEIEANERYGPRGRNERYERRDSESVDGRYETAYAKLIAQSARKGRSHRQQGGVVRGGREDNDPWKADAGIAVPKVGKFRENL